MVMTENLNVEYSLLYLLFAKPKETCNYFASNDLVPDYFASFFHRQIIEYAMNFVADGNVLKIGSFRQRFLSRPNATIEDDAKFSDMLANIKANKPKSFDEIEVLFPILSECYVNRKVQNEIEKFIDNKDNKGIADNLGSLLQSCRKYSDVLDRRNEKNVMGLREGLDKRIDRAKEIFDNPDKAGMVMTGLKNIDKWIGRQSPGDLVIYQASTGVGKSMMLMGTALANYKRGLKVIVITIEMSYMQYLNRFDSNLTGIEHKEFTQGSVSADPDLVKKWRDRINKVAKYDEDLYVYWEPDNCTPARVESIIEKNPYKPDLVIVDYAGDMSSGLRGVPNNDPKAQAEIYDKLKSIAGKCECVIYTAQQSIRGSKGKASVETGAWSFKAAARADIMMAVEQTKEDEDFMTENDDGTVTIGRMTVRVLKIRNGARCKTHIIPRFNRMTWLEKEEEEMLQDGNVKEYKTKKSEMNKAEKELTEKAYGKNEAPTELPQPDDEYDDIFEDE